MERRTMKYKVEIKQEPDEDIDIEEHPVKIENEEEEDIEDWCVKIEEVKQESKTETATKKFSKKKSKIQCSVCSKTFSIAANLRRHVKHIHSKVNVFPCDLCSKIYYRRDYLIRHKRNHSSKTTDCECGRRIKKDNEKHKFLHCKWRNKKMATTAKYQYQCKVCLKKFKLASELSKHYALQKRYHNFFCDYCNQAFYKKTQLEPHVKIHMGLVEYPYDCEICGKKYRCKPSLETHLVSHTGVKPFSCSKCHKEFASKWGWMCHEKTQNCV